MSWLVIAPAWRRPRPGPVSGSAVFVSPAVAVGWGREGAGHDDRGVGRDLPRGLYGDNCPRLLMAVVPPGQLDPQAKLLQLPANRADWLPGQGGQAHIGQMRSCGRGAHRCRSALMRHPVGCPGAAAISQLRLQDHHIRWPQPERSRAPVQDRPEDTRRVPHAQPLHCPAPRDQGVALAVRQNPQSGIGAVGRNKFGPQRGP
jgi:hypothetical protein